MDFLSALRMFKEWAIGAIPKAVSRNRQLREEIRGIVGDLADDLISGLNLVSMRLRASKRIADDDEFLQYLAESEGKIFATFSEFRVCADLRNLEDRFERFFDPARAAVEVAHVSEVRNLISSLEDHERLVFDMVHEPWKAIDDAVNSGIPREQIHRLLDKAVEDCEDKAQQVRALARSIMDSV